MKQIKKVNRKQSPNTFTSSFGFLLTSSIGLFLAIALLQPASGYAQQQHLSQQQKTSTLKVMTYNILHGAPPGLAGTSHEIDLTKVAEVIKAQNPDIVAIQEVDSLWSRSDNQDQTKVLSELTGLHYYHYSDSRSFTDTAGWGYGIGILSKYPLKDTLTVFLDHNNHPGSEIWVNSVATVTLPTGKDIRFISAHYDYLNEDNRILEVKQTSLMADTSSIPVILAGDLNTEPHERPIKILAQSFNRSCADCQLSWPSDKPRMKLDYIMSSKKSGLQLISSGLIQGEAAVFASDHLPYVAVYSYSY